MTYEPSYVPSRTDIDPPPPPSTDLKDSIARKRDELFIQPKKTHDAWAAVGRALVRLADGTEPLPEGGAESVDDFVKRVGKANIAKMPPWIKVIRYHQNDHEDGVFHMMLPSQEVIRDSVANSKNTALASPDVDATYLHPPCIQVQQNTTEEKVLKELVAYYSISHCQ
jgi:hypothetical protein